MITNIPGEVRISLCYYTWKQFDMDFRLIMLSSFVLLKDGRGSDADFL